MPTNREIRLSIGDHDICGIRCDERTAVFYSCDNDLTLHTTAHSASPALGHTDGVIHTRGGGSRNAAGVIWVDQGGLFVGDIADVQQPERLGRVIFMLEPDSLERYPAPGADGRNRITMADQDSPNQTVTVTALLVPQNNLYAVHPYLPGVRLIGIEPTARPWLILMAE